MQILENVIVIGGGHHNTLGVVRALGERGYGVDLVTIGRNKDRYVSSSRYVKNHNFLKHVDDLTGFLLTKAHRDDTKKQIVISCADVVTEHLNLNYDRLACYFILPGCNEQGKIARLMDKTTMILMASKRGLKAPTIWRLPQDREQVMFPCITKAYVSSHGGKADVKVIRKREDFEAFMVGCKDKIFVQPFVEKKEEVQFIGCSIRGGEDIIIPGMTRILRSQPNTNTGFLEYGPIDPFYYDTVERSKQYIKDCGYSGLFSIEFLRSMNDEIFFLEINFRNDGNAWCVTAAGVNLPVIWVKANRGLGYEDEIYKVKKIIVMPEFQDFKLVLQRKVKIGRWLKDVRRTDAFLDWNKNDKKPFFWFILNKLWIKST